MVAKFMQSVSSYFCPRLSLAASLECTHLVNTLLRVGTASEMSNVHRSFHFHFVKLSVCSKRVTRSRVAVV